MGRYDIDSKSDNAEGTEELFMEGDDVKSSVAVEIVTTVLYISPLLRLHSRLTQIYTRFYPSHSPLLL